MILKDLEMNTQPIHLQSQNTKESSCIDNKSCANYKMLHDCIRELNLLKSDIDSISKVKLCLMKYLQQKDEVNLGLKNTNVKLLREVNLLKSIIIKKKVYSSEELNNYLHLKNQEINLNSNQMSGIFSPQNGNSKPKVVKAFKNAPLGNFSEFKASLTEKLKAATIQSSNDETYFMQDNINLNPKEVKEKKIPLIVSKFSIKKDEDLNIKVFGKQAEPRPLTSRQGSCIFKGVSTTKLNYSRIENSKLRRQQTYNINADDSARSKSGIFMKSKQKLLIDIEKERSNSHNKSNSSLKDESLDEKYFKKNLYYNKIASNIELNSKRSLSNLLSFQKLMVNQDFDTYLNIEYNTVTDCEKYLYKLNTDKFMTRPTIFSIQNLNNSTILPQATSRSINKSKKNVVSDLSIISKGDNQAKQSLIEKIKKTKDIKEAFEKYKEDIFNNFSILLVNYKTVLNLFYCYIFSIKSVFSTSIYIDFYKLNSLDEFIFNAISRLKEAIKCEEVYFYLYYSNKCLMKRYKVTGKELKAEFLNLQGIAYQVIKSSCVVNTDNFHDSYCRDTDIVSDHGVHNLLCIPIKYSKPQSTDEIKSEQKKHRGSSSTLSYPRSPNLKPRILKAFVSTVIGCIQCGNTEHFCLGKDRKGSKCFSDIQKQFVEYYSNFISSWLMSLETKKVTENLVTRMSKSYDLGIKLMDLAYHSYYDLSSLYHRIGDTLVRELNSIFESNLTQVFVCRNNSIFKIEKEEFMFCKSVNKFSECLISYVNLNKRSIFSRAGQKNELYDKNIDITSSEDVFTFPIVIDTHFNDLPWNSTDDPIKLDIGGMKREPVVIIVQIEYNSFINFEHGVLDQDSKLLEDFLSKIIKNLIGKLQIASIGIGI